MTSIGRYEIIESRGAGSMGTVYRARDTVLDRDVALKTIRTGTAVEPELRERFYREAKACARLQHPGIVSVYDLGEADGVAFIAMELLDGTDFRKAIDQRTDVPLSKKIDAMCQVCDALSHAHQHGIIHRDIKPSNLFLLSDMRAKVLDFGIARLPSSHLTVAGQILGTPNYMAPEQILSKPADMRSDLFSAALVFFEFLVYSHPFKSPMIPRRVVEGEPDSLLDYDSSLPAPLDRIFMRALAKDPEQRYRSGVDFANDLRALLDSMRKDASPSFRSTVLPSDRAIPEDTLSIAPHPVDLTLVKQPPPGEDPYEWRLSEVLRLVPEFEDAVDHADTIQAERLLRELEAINAVDARFTDTLAFCRTLFAKIAPVPKVELAPKTSPPPPSRQQPSPPLTSPSSSSPPFPSPKSDPPSLNPTSLNPTSLNPTSLEPTKLNPTLLDRTKFSPTQFNATPLNPTQLNPTPARPPDSVLSLPVSEPVRPPVPPQKPAPSANTSRAASVPVWRSPIALVSAAVILIAAILAVRALVFRPVHVEPSVGSGVVSVPDSTIFKDADGQSAIVQLAKSQSVNLLELPSSRDQEWIRVQFVPAAEKASPPGFLRLHDLDLANLQTGDAKTQLTLIRLLLGDPSDASAMQLEEDALKALIGRFPGTPAIKEAGLDVAQIELKTAKLLKDAGQAEAVWAPHLDVARQYVDMAGNDAALAERVDQLRQQIAEMTPVVKPQPPITIQRIIPTHSDSGSSAAGTKVPTQNDIKEMLDKAEVVYRSGNSVAEQSANLRAAEDLVRKALKADPKNAKAEGLLKKIKDLQAILP